MDKKLSIKYWYRNSGPHWRYLCFQGCGAVQYLLGIRYWYIRNQLFPKVSDPDQAVDPETQYAVFAKIILKKVFDICTVFT